MENRPVRHRATVAAVRAAEAEDSLPPRPVMFCGAHDLADTLTVTLGDAKITAPLTAIYRRGEIPRHNDEGTMESEEEAE